MTRDTLFALVVATALVPMSFAPALPAQATPAVRALRVGLGEEDITPPVGTPMGGYLRKDVSTGVHDPLYARSLLVEDATGTAVVLMTVSVVSLPRPVVERIRVRIEEQTGIPARSMLISANHTHSGPDLRRAGEDYLRALVERSAASAVAAWKSRAPARIGFGKTRVEELGRNNRRLLYGGLHPDPEVAMVKIEDARGRLLGVAFNYGCHPSALDLSNLQFTEDWPYYTILGIKEALGKQVWAAYYQAAEGDIKVGYTAELSAIGADIPIRNWAYAEQKGRQMAVAVLKALPAIQARDSAEVEVVSDLFRLPLREHFPETLEQAQQKAAEAERRVADLEAATRKERFVGRRVLDQARVDSFLAGLNLETARWFYSGERKPDVQVELQAVRIGDTVFVGFPGEVFSEIGLKVKRKSPFPSTFVVGLANGSHGAGYLPTAEEFAEGGYEVLGSKFSEDAAKVLMDSSLALLGRLGGKRP